MEVKQDESYGKDSNSLGRVNSNDQAMENLARYIIRASFSQERMTYIPEESKVIYQSKDGKHGKVFDALEWPRRQAGCKHSRPCAPMCLTRASRW